MFSNDPHPGTYGQKAVVTDSGTCKKSGEALFKKAKSTRTRAFLAFVLMFIPVSIACTGPEKGECIFACQDRVADAVSIIAVEKGFFKEEGLKLIPKIFSSGPQCMEALTSGNADFGTMGDTTAIIVGSKKGDAFRIACALGGGEHRHRIIVAKNGGINNIAELEGKRIGIKKGTSTHGGLMRFARIHGIDLNDEMIDMSPSLQLTALAAGELDAVAASEPTPSQTEAGGYGHELTTLGNLNNTYPVLLVVSSSFARQHPETIVSVLRALTRAKGFVENHFDEAAEILSRTTGLDMAVIKKAMRLHCYDVALNRETLDSLKSTANFLKGIGRIRELPDFDQVIDTSYLEQSRKSFK
ncbi:MAG: ABC transporter substrate-binding protein [Deltaproteobacteria bacterium]|nr:ABC transporter substrate-binding protein [Deltaproteobacteria bacterium]